MLYKPTCLLVLSIFAGLLLQTGCSSSTQPLVPVRGIVSYQGQLLRSGTIVFTPDASRGCHGPMAHAEIQPDGGFTLHTGDAAGAVAGWHRITVLAVQEPGLPSSGQRFVIPPSLVPEKYRSPDLSGLVREVKAGQENILQIDLD